MSLLACHNTHQGSDCYNSSFIILSSKNSGQQLPSYITFSRENKRNGVNQHRISKSGIVFVFFTLSAGIFFIWHVL